MNYYEIIFTGLILCLLLAPISIMAQPSISKPYIEIPSIYSENSITIDGKYDDWSEQKSKHVRFEDKPLFVSSNQYNTLFGDIIIRNNSTHLSTIIKLTTAEPVIEEYRSIIIAFDENDDGVLASGDNIIIVRSEGPNYKTQLRDGYYTENQSFELDPDKDENVFDATINHVSDSEIVLETIMPFTDTNDFYDFQMNVERSFSFRISYDVGEFSTNASTYTVFFTYNMAQDPEWGNAGLTIFMVFILTLIVSISIVVILTWNKEKTIQSLPKKFTIIIPIILIVSILFIVSSSEFEQESASFIGNMGKNINNDNQLNAIIFAIIVGILPSLLAYILFKRLSVLFVGHSYGLKILLLASTFLFVIAIIPRLLQPFVQIILGLTVFFNNQHLETTRSQIEMFMQITSSGFDGLLLTPLLIAFSIWIPSMLLFYALYEFNKERKTKQNMLPKIIGISLIFTVLVIPTIIGNVSKIPIELGSFIILSGPIITPLILAFLAAEGYSKSIKSSMKKITTSSNNLSFGRFTKIIFGVIFVVGIIGLLRNVFLVFVPIVNLESSDSTSIIHSLFVNFLTEYVILQSGESLKSANLIFTSFVTFFSFFWIYDIIMILRGFGMEFINSENVIYKKIKEGIGSYTAISMVSLLILFMVSTAIFDLKLNEMLGTLPSWVVTEIGITPIDLPKQFTDIQKTINTIVGIGTISGIIYFLYRTKSQ